MLAVMADAALRRLVVPDLDDELNDFTEPLDEALRHLAGTASDPDAAPLPPILAGPGSEALAELRYAIHTATPIVLRGPDGRYEHEPLRLVDVEAADVAMLGQLLAELRRVVVETGYHGDVDEYLNDFLADYPQAELDSGQALELLARFQGVVDLDNSAALAILDGPLERARTGLARVVLTDDEEAAYRRLRDRWVAMWHDHSSIERWLY